jgi:hypothetical protein
MRWWRQMNATTMGLRILSWYLCAFKLQSIKCSCVHCPLLTPDHTLTWPPPWGTLLTMLTSANCLHTRHHTCCLPSARYSWNRDSRDGFWQLVQKLFTCANPQFHQLSGWLVSDYPAGEEAGCGGPGLTGLHLICGCVAGWTYCQIL